MCVVRGLALLVDGADRVGLCDECVHDGDGGDDEGGERTREYEGKQVPLCTLALPALWTGLLYDDAALDAALDLARPWDAETREGLRVAASVSALAGEAGGVRLQDAARRTVEIADAGLRARGLGEERLLDPLRRSVETGRVQADDLLDAFEGPWGRDLSRAYEACRL